MWWAPLAAVIFFAERGHCVFQRMHRARRSEMPPESALKAHLGQTFIVGIPGPALDPATEQLLRYIQPGGIVLYFRNFSSAVQLQHLISPLHNLAPETTRHPFLIMLHQKPRRATPPAPIRNRFPLCEPHCTAHAH